MEDFEMQTIQKLMQENMQYRQILRRPDVQELLNKSIQQPKNNARKSKLHNSDSD